MRLLVFFDLPRNTANEMKVANQFRKSLLKDGFIMLQESVYCKLALNATALNNIKAKTKKCLPQNGSVMMLTVTEKQFESMDICCDAFVSEVLDKDTRLVII